MGETPMELRVGDIRAFMDAITKAARTLAEAYEPPPEPVPVPRDKYDALKQAVRVYDTNDCMDVEFPIQAARALIAAVDKQDACLSSEGLAPKPSLEGDQHE